MTDQVAPASDGSTHGFLFSDLRGYTHLVDTRGAVAASHLLSRYRAIVRAVVAQHGGAEIKTEGDSFYVVLPSASAALRCGLDILKSCTAPADGGEAIQLGIGIHAGEAVAHEGGFVGSAINIAARICALASAGEVLVTGTIRELTRSIVPAGFVFVGRRQLKGLDQPVEVFRVVPDGAVSPVRRRTLTAPAGRRLGWLAVAAVVVVVATAVFVNLAGNAARLPAGSLGAASQALGRSVAWRVYPDVDVGFGAEPPDPDLFQSAHINGVSASGEGYVAVGAVRNEASVAIWDTANGHNWERALDVEGIESGSVLADVASAVPSSGRLVLIGATCTGACQPAAWWNVDAAIAGLKTRWMRASFRNGDLPADTTLLSVGAGGAGYIAVGLTGTSPVTAFWTSSDGATWNRISLSGTPPGSGVRDVVGGGPGFIAVGSTGIDGTIWTSSDGASWSEAPGNGAFAGMTLDSVTKTSDGFLLTGHGAAGPAVWSSADGITWNLTTGLPHLSFVVLRGIASNAGAPIVAVGDGPTGEVVLLGR